MNGEVQWPPRPSPTPWARPIRRYSSLLAALLVLVALALLVLMALVLDVKLVQNTVLLLLMVLVLVSTSDTGGFVSHI